MPFQPDDKTLRQWIREAVDSDDIRPRAAQADLSVDRLENVLVRSKDEIWMAGTRQMEAFKEAQKEFTDGYTTRGASSPKASRWLFLGRVIVWGVIPLLFIQYVAAGFYYGWVEVHADLTPSEWLFWPVGPLLILLIALAIFYYVKAEIELKRNLAMHSADEDELYTASRTRRDEAREEIKKAVITQGIKPRLKELIDSQLTIPFTHTLPRLNFSGLAEVFDSLNEVPTEAKGKLDFMLETMPGGSIGIAGPRGAGKTTLLKSACREPVTDTPIPKRLAVLTSAPVEYQSRDFVLHLFSSVCEKVVEVVSGRRRPQTAMPDPLQESYARFFFVTLAPMIQRACLVLGAALIGAGLVYAVVLMKNAPQSGQQSGRQSGAGAGAAQTEGADEAAGDEGSSDEVKKSKEAPPAGAAARYAEATGIKPSLMLTWGAYLLVFYIALRYLRLGYRKWMYETSHLFTASSNYLQPLNDPPPTPHTAHTARVPADVAARLREVEAEAEGWLERIKFQQSYTTGWSGSMKFPIGLEGGLSRANSLARQQLSLPEIVHGLYDFLSHVARDFQVIIGIDEMDKIESDEAAQKFLNEIKAIFGLPKVFYLISVSENAMSNFERRGLPFRDVFDSSFDNIVYVDYLTLDAARRLISRRVIGMPPPFVHLCYCLSGGLARDLVRACRNMMELSSPATPAPANSGARQAAGARLSSLCRALIADDLELKIQATVITARKAGQEEVVSAFIDELHKLEAGVKAGRLTLDCYTDLMKGTCGRQRAAPNGNGRRTVQDFMQLYEELKKKSISAGEESGEEAGAADSICAMAEQLATYVYYCVTLLQFFGDELDAGKLALAEHNKSFEQLARARQLIAVNPRASRNLIDSFRKEYIPSPRPTTAPAPSGVS